MSILIRKKKVYETKGNHDDVVRWMEEWMTNGTEGVRLASILTLHRFCHHRRHVSFTVIVQVKILKKCDDVEKKFSCYNEL